MELWVIRRAICAEVRPPRSRGDLGSFAFGGRGDRRVAESRRPLPISVNNYLSKESELPTVTSSIGFARIK